MLKSKVTTKMNKLIKKLILFLVATALLISVLCCNTLAMTNTLKIKLEDSSKNPIEKIDVSVCKIADYNAGNYAFTENFENSGLILSSLLNLQNPATALDVEEYISKNNIECLTTSSLSDGFAKFDGINMGIWIVMCKSNTLYSFAPYIIDINNTNISSDLVTIPKLEQIKTKININVCKIWDDNNDKKLRPNDIQVELLADGKVVNTATLSSQSGWQFTFENCDKDKNYTVVEKAVKNYTASYGGTAENGFIITNTYNGDKLPQTGQLWWPALILFVAGVCFMTLGIIERKVKKNGK